MTQSNLLSVSRIAQELNAGKATIKFLLKRFKENIPSELIDGQTLYPTDTIKTLCLIQEKLEMGLLPSDIEKDLSTQSDQDSNPLKSLESLSNNSDIRLSSDGLDMLKSLFSDIGEQQNRIADAHEKRAQVEERKAVAIEKRAQAEEKKAAAMNNIAAALQEMNQLRSTDTTNQQIAHQAATVIITDENNEPYEPHETEKIDDDLSDLISDSDTIDDTNNIADTDADLSSLLEGNEMPQEDSIEDPLSEDPLSNGESDFDIDQELEDSLDDPLNELDEDLDQDLLLDDIDDLESLTAEENIATDTEDTSQKIDDLSLLLDDQVETPDKNTPNENTIDDTQPDDTQPDNTPEEETPAAEDTSIDDLSKLIDEPDISEPETSQTDDLSLLIDAETNEEQKNDADTNKEDTSESQLDDLSALLDQESEQPETKQDINPDIDDLSKLIETTEKTDSSESTSDLDDLSLLIEPDSKETDNKETDNKESAERNSTPMDDLSKLIDSPTDSKESSPPQNKDKAEPQKAPLEKDEKPSEETTPEIKIDISPEDDLGKYKAAITKVIIELKASGLTVEEATDRLNKNKVKTLSGKEQWGQKAISQIYKFIDSAK